MSETKVCALTDLEFDVDSDVKAVKIRGQRIATTVEIEWDSTAETDSARMIIDSESVVIKPVVRSQAESVSEIPDPIVGDVTDALDTSTLDGD